MPPAPPIAQAKVMFRIDLTNETTEDFFDDRRNGGSETFQTLQVLGPGGQVMGIKNMRGRTIWDCYATAALASFIQATVKVIPGEVGQPDIITGVGQIKEAVAFAAAYADAMIDEKRRRDPQRMLVEAGTKLVDADGKPAHKAFDKT
jgi:hypothetical protein